MPSRQGSYLGRQEDESEEDESTCGDAHPPLNSAHIRGNFPPLLSPNECLLIPGIFATTPRAFGHSESIGPLVISNHRNAQPNGEQSESRQEQELGNALVGESHLLCVCRRNGLG
jgi:hypothetical protein